MKELSLKEHLQMAENLSELLSCDRIIQTHISTILLGRNTVYKLKKPVDFGFLDYSSLKKRESNCVKEVELNGRFAPKLHPTVVRVTGSIEAPEIEGKGLVVDYAVQMQAFRQEDQLDNRVEEYGMNDLLADEIAGVVADLHNEALVATAESDYGTPERIFAPMTENFERLESLTKDETVQEMLSRLRKWTVTEFERVKPLLKKRKKGGFIRSCHGDIHLHNIALFEKKPILFDAIEFNDYLSNIDVISDLAFLIMDLEFRGFADKSCRILNLYLEKTRDYEGVGVLNLYKTYRAVVRAKVAALRADQMTEEKERQAVIDEAVQYLELALSSTEKKEVCLAITHGLSGSGKSMCGMLLAEKAGFIRIRSDVVRMGLGIGEKNRYSKEVTKDTYDKLKAFSIAVLRSGYSVVADATFLKKWQRELFLNTALTEGVPFYIIDLQCDMKLLESRVEKRTRERSDVSEADLAVLKMQAENEEPLLKKELNYTVPFDCTTLESLNDSVEAFII